jgi:hypothetical protein
MNLAMFSIAWNVHASKDKCSLPCVWHVMNAGECSSDRSTVLLRDVPSV